MTIDPGLLGKCFQAAQISLERLLNGRGELDRIFLIQPDASIGDSAHETAGQVMKKFFATASDLRHNLRQRRQQSSRDNQDDPDVATLPVPN